MFHHLVIHREKIVQTELKYYKHTHASDIIARRDLFRIYIPHIKKLENLGELLSDETHDETLTDNSILLPSNEEALKILREESKTITEINTECHQCLL